MTRRTRVAEFSECGRTKTNTLVQEPQESTVHSLYRWTSEGTTLVWVWSVHLSDTRLYLSPKIELPPSLLLSLSLCLSMSKSRGSIRSTPGSVVFRLYSMGMTRPNVITRCLITTYIMMIIS